MTQNNININKGISTLRSLKPKLIDSITLLNKDNRNNDNLSINHSQGESDKTDGK